ncbi:hypothetical protein M0802_006274 [Mischocyttarus mexicanus]|nr:hypothetical protein M0802_006274 [Mischocyttarus mexicanus]
MIFLVHLFTALQDPLIIYDIRRSRAAQKLNLSSSPHRRRRSGDENIGPEEQLIFPNGYAALLLKSPPPAPPALLRRIGVKELTGVGKVCRDINHGESFNDYKRIDGDDDDSSSSSSSSDGNGREKKES